MNVPKATLRQCIDTFFKVLWPNPEYGFIHKAVFLQQFNADEIEPALLHAVCGNAARFCVGTSPEQGSAWIAQAEEELMKSFDRPSVVRLQALQLVVLHRKYMREYRKTLSLFALCTRMAFLLRLNYEDPTLSFIAQESRRRLIWSIWITDTFLAGGIGDFTLCSTDRIHVRLPCDEQSFQLDRATDTETLKATANGSSLHQLSLTAHFIRVCDVRDRILRYACHHH